MHPCQQPQTGEGTSLLLTYRLEYLSSLSADPQLHIVPLHCSTVREAVTILCDM